MTTETKESSEKDLGRVLGVFNGYDPEAKVIVCTSLEEAKARCMEIVQYRALMSLGITNEQMEEAVKKVALEGKVKIAQLSLHRAPEPTEEEKKASVKEKLEQKIAALETARKARTEKSE